MAQPQYYWVTWSRNAKDETAARKSAMIWGPQTDAPPQLNDMFLAGPFRTKQAAQAYEDAIGKNTLIPPPGTPVVGNVQAPAPLAGLQAVGSFFNKLGQANTWIRAGEIVLGLILIAVGVARITHAENFISKAVKAVPL